MLGCRSVPTSPRQHSRIRSPPVSGRLHGRVGRVAVSQATSRQASPNPISPRVIRSAAESKAFIESLVRKHKQTLNHLIQLRKRKLAEEIKELKPIPTISKRSQVLVQTTRKSTQVRAIHKPKEVEIKLELSREDVKELFPSHPEVRSSLPSSRNTMSRLGIGGESVYLADFLARKSFADPFEQELSGTSSVAYRANAIPELGVKVRLPNSLSSQYS